MKRIIFAAMLAFGFGACAETYVVELQFSADTNDVVSASISENGQGRKDFDAILNVKGKEIGLGTQLIVSKFVRIENNEIDLEFSASKRFISQWQKLPNGRNIPYFTERSINDIKLSLILGDWTDLGKFPNQEHMRIRITKK